jgi:hypothetical protein
MEWVINATTRQLYLREKSGTHCIGGWIGPRAVLDECGKSRPHRDSITETVQPVTSRYTDWAIPVRTWDKRLSSGTILRASIRHHSKFPQSSLYNTLNSSTVCTLSVSILHSQPSIWCKEEKLRFTVEILAVSAAEDVLRATNSDN